MIDCRCKWDKPGQCKHCRDESKKDTPERLQRAQQALQGAARLLRLAEQLQGEVEQGLQERWKQAERRQRELTERHRQAMLF